MSDVLWLRIRSWHVVRTMTRGGRWLTLCGRQAPAEGETQATLPAGASCESCLRITARKNDQP